MSRLAEKVAIVTGGGRGLGEATARLFAEEGAQVVVADVNGGAAERVATGIATAGGLVQAFEADVAAIEDARDLVEFAVSAFGRIDVLVNNAGIASAGSVVDVSLDEWDRVMAINLTGAFLCSRFAVPHMERQGGGSIVCVSSASGVIGQKGQVAYNVSKHAVIGLVRCMALDHAAAGIRVNAVCPGVMATPMLDALSEAQLADLRAMHPLGRVGDPEEIARAILHLAGDEASFTTGSVVLVDGGLTAM